MATLLLELSLTRIFSVVFYYHFAFLAISIALFGLGLGGVFSYVVANWKAPLFTRLGRLSALNSLFVLLALYVILAQQDKPSNWYLALIYFTTALPFLVAGAIVSLAISETIEQVNRVYFFDLLGAAAGCLVLLGLLTLVEGPGTVIAAAVIFATAAAIWHSLAGSVAGRAGSVALALGLVAFLVYNHDGSVLGVRHAKDHLIANESFHAWNSFSRIGVVQAPDSSEVSIVIDADAATGIFTYDLDNLTTDERHQLLDMGPALPYRVRPAAKALIVGPGGGWDVARAWTAGSRDITGVEINGIIARTVMQDKFLKMSHGLYKRPGIHIEVEDGRSFVRRSHEKYQVLQATLVDTWAATAAGAFALSENNLYTTDAFRDYLTHLTDDGVMTFTRWGFDPPRESLRLVTLAMNGLARIGETNPAQHVMVVRDDTSKLYGWGAQDTVLISRKPFTDGDVARAKQLLSETKMEAVYLPGANGAPAIGSGNPFGQLLTSPDPPAFWQGYRYDVSPVSDDRPFFFYTVQPRDLWNFVMTASTESADYKVNRAIPLLFALVAVSIGATLLILFLPRLVLGTRLPKQKGVFVFLMYFLCLGAGYILIQVALIQKFVLLLGHPTYALTVIVFSMLVASGAGSFWSRRFVADSDAKLTRVLA